MTKYKLSNNSIQKNYNIGSQLFPYFYTNRHNTIDNAIN